MLTNKMTLTEMAKFEPSEADMAALPLEDVVYIKVSLISMSKVDNYDFIRFFFSDEEINDYLNNVSDTIIFDFDGKNTDQEKFITIFDLTSRIRYEELSAYLEELLNKYTHEADVIIDLYTHDSKKYRLSNLEGIVKLEPI